MNKRTALAEAVRLLSRRGLSCQEIRFKLARKSYDEHDIDMAIDRLMERGYLNDTALCADICQQLLNGGRYGRKAIHYKLRQQGFSQQDVEAALAEYDPQEDYEKAQQLLQRQMKADDIAQQKDKAGRFLMNRGFSTEIIMKILDNF